MSAQPGKAGDKPKQPDRGPAVARAVAPPPSPPLRRKLSRTTIILWLIAAGTIILFLPLSLIAGGISDDTKRTTADLVSVQVSLTSVPTPVPEILALNGTLTALQQQKAQVDAIVPTLTAPRLNWPAIMAAIGNYDPNQVLITSLDRSSNRLTLIGLANSDTTVIAYQNALDQSRQFSNVFVQSIRVIATPIITITSTPTLTTPTLTLTPTATFTATLTPSPTPDPSDQYEPDNAQPSPIALGVTQLHNFYPDGDVDTANFLAKAGRYYHVFTSNLAPGVDTYISIRAGANTYTNDDVGPGDLSSSVTFQNTSGADAVAVVTVSNRGQYGADKTYRLAVEEIVPNATSTPTIAPTPTPTSTGLPPATPTPTLTPTPDLRDSYEPDDVNPKQIAIGETQAHNFYPNNDIDKITFVVKGGRIYQVFTSDLALGVDTFLSVQSGFQPPWTNDDYTPPGSSNYASAVCFQAPQDGSAVATISNLGQDYGPAKTYKVTVNEVPSLGTAPCAPLPTATPTVTATPSPTSTFTRTPTPSPSATASAARRVPGLAVLAINDNSIDRLQLVSHDKHPPLQSQMTVEFVIILELKLVTP